jgi:mitotic spindle assembly checkpoint protein MAD2
MHPAAPHNQWITPQPLTTAENFAKLSEVNIQIHDHSVNTEIANPNVVHLAVQTAASDRNGRRSARERQSQGAQAFAERQRKACRRVCKSPPQVEMRLRDGVSPASTTLKLTAFLPTDTVPILDTHDSVRLDITNIPLNMRSNANDSSFQRGVYPAEDFTAVKKYGLNMLVSSDDQVRAYIKKIMSQLDKWMVGGKISKLVIVITDKDTGENIERWQFDVRLLPPPILQPTSICVYPSIPANPSSPAQVQILAKPKSKPTSSSSSSSSKPKPTAPSTSSTNINQENTPSDPTAPSPSGTGTPGVEKTEAEIQSEIAAIFRQITASVTFLPQLSGDCTFNVLVYADASSEVPVEWGDSDAKEIVNGERVQLRGFSTASHRVDTLVSYRLQD